MRTAQKYLASWVYTPTLFVFNLDFYPPSKIWGRLLDFVEQTSRRKYYFRHPKFFFQQVLTSWMVILSSCLIWQIISFILPLNVYDDLQKMPILAKEIIFPNEAHFDLGVYVNKRNCRIWDTENLHAYIDKPTHPKRVTVWCGFWSRGIIRLFFFRKDQNGPFFLRKWVRRSCYSQWQSLLGHVKRIFVH